MVNRVIYWFIICGYVLNAQEREQGTLFTGAFVQSAYSTYANSLEYSLPDLMSASHLRYYLGNDYFPWGWV